MIKPDPLPGDSKDGSDFKRQVFIVDELKPIYGQSKSETLTGVITNTLLVRQLVTTSHFF